MALRLAQLVGYEATACRQTEVHHCGCLWILPMHQLEVAKGLDDVQENGASKEEHEQHLQQVVTFVEQHSGALMVDKLDTQLHFKVPTDCEAKLSAFFQQVKVCFSTWHV